PNVFSPMSSVKKTSSANYVLLNSFAQRSKLDDLIILDTDGSVSECLYASLFWIKDNELYTPSYLTGCIDGIMKKQLLRTAIQLGIPFNEGTYTPDEVLEADFVFRANIAGFGIIHTIEDTNFSDKHELFDQLINTFV
ncbi:MAG: aminotransferase class IV, partial [Cyclobacteriaceae bacterium]